MEVNFDVYLDSETKKILDYLSAHGADDGEKDAIISAFARMLSDNVINKNNLRDYEPMMYFTSLKYIDARIATILNDLNASYEDNELALGLCTREKELLEVFAVRKWQLPSLKNAELDKCMNVLRNRAASTSIIDRIVIRNGKVNELINIAEQELSVATCDKALAEVGELANDIASCRSMKTAVPDIENLNTEAAKNRIIEIRKISKQKEGLEKDICDVDLQIHSIVSLANTTQKQWLDVISLCYKQKELLSNCRSRGWSLPLIRYENPESMINKYKHYVDMDNLDKKIMANQGKISNKKAREAIYADCVHQNANITICIENGWEIPELAVSHPLDLVENARKEEKAKERRNNLRKFKIKLVFGAIICIIVAVVGFKIYTRDKKPLPFNSNEVCGKNRYEIEKELNLIGFHNIKPVEDKYSEGDFAEDDITRVVVNERSDFNRWQYWKKDAQIIISYHVYAISIGESSEELKGQNYLDVKGKLKRLGFNNIEEPEIVEENGWGKPFGIVSISVNGEDSFEKNAKYKPNDRIIITYSSGDREDVTSVVKNWKSQKYQALLKGLRYKRISNVKAVTKDSTNRNNEQFVADILIGGDLFDEGECWIDQDTEVTVEYYRFKRVRIGNTNKSFEKRDYNEVVNELKELGFINITPRRTNSLSDFNLFTKGNEGLVNRVLIDGREDYDETRVFDCDVPVTVEVYTFKDKGYEDIPE